MIKSDSEFLQVALNHYDNPHLSFIGEFESDLKRFTSLNILLNRYKDDRTDLRKNMIINHIIILENCFSLPVLIKMIEYKIHETKIINSFLFYMEKIDSMDIDEELLGKLNEE